MKLCDYQTAIKRSLKSKSFATIASIRTIPLGKHKARVFSAALGITLRDADWLRERALEIALSDDTRQGAASVFGAKYVIDSELEHEGMSAIVRFSWIIEFGTDFPRLTSCYVK